jgi:hypothetical protein
LNWKEKLKKRRKKKSAKQTNKLQLMQSLEQQEILLQKQHGNGAHLWDRLDLEKAEEEVLIALEMIAGEDLEEKIATDDYIL